MAKENPLWSRRRIGAELAKLGDETSMVIVPARWLRTSVPERCDGGCRGTCGGLGMYLAAERFVGTPRRELLDRMIVTPPR